MEVKKSPGTVYSWAELRETLRQPLRIQPLQIDIVRHGETETNAAGLVSGLADVALTERGRQQARMAGRHLRGEYGAVFSSNLQRSIESTRLMMDGSESSTGTRSVDARLAERSLGVLEQLPATHIDAFARGDLLYAPDRGENYLSVAQRVLSFLVDLVRANDPDPRRVLVSTHMGPMRIMVGILRSQHDAREVLNLRFPNSQIIPIHLTELRFPPFVEEALAMQQMLPVVPSYLSLTRYHAMARNWEFSRGVLQKLRDELKDAFDDSVVTVAMAGSIGRLEASDQSDADYIMIVRKKEDGERNIGIMNTYLRGLQLSTPNPKGVFATARTIDELISEAGTAGESLDILGKRMLLLLESRAVYSDAGYRETIDTVLNRYATYLMTEPTKEFVFLLNDLIRYFRFICVNYESNFRRENEKWCIRNVKLRHSRVVMYAGLLLLIGEASKQGAKIEWLREQLSLTPLDRIAAVYKFNDDRSFARVAGLYNVFLSQLSKQEVREELNVGYDSRYDNPAFSQLKANSDALVAELMRFVFSRRGVWSERFFEYLIF